MATKTIQVPESIHLLHQEFEQFRRTRTGRMKIPEALWQAAVEQARQHRVNLVAHTLGLDYSALKKRLNGISKPRRQVGPPAFVELLNAADVRSDEYVIEFGSSPQSADAGAAEGRIVPDWSALLSAWQEATR
ncbi:MAG TPA: hypothetical protein VK638_14855 [Edaphobacter sp.]|nr:hypothetical protein [Edaphobacter sp.]